MNIPEMTCRDILDQLNSRQLAEIEVLILTQEYQDKIIGDLKQLAIDDPTKYFIDMIHITEKPKNKVHREFRSWAILNNKTLLIGDVSLNQFLEKATRYFMNVTDRNPKIKPCTMFTQRPTDGKGKLQIHGVFEMSITKVEREK